jgi:pimeloyl-ACP methyl ester carboxylesterase
MKAALVIALTLLAMSAWALWTPDLNRTALEQRYLQAPGDMVQVLGTPLHVRESGPKDAPAVLLLHGFGSSLETWETWTPALSAGLRVMRVDLPGSGLSPPDSSQDYSDARSVALISALLDARGIQKTHVVGHSIGGRIAWTFAATHPQRVNKLVLLAPDGFASPGFAYGVAPEVPATLGLMRWTLPRWLLRMNLAAGYAEPKALSDAALQRYHDLMRAPGARQAMLSRLQQTVLVDPVPQLQRITAPTLLVWGRDDAMIPFSNAADYQRALAQATLVPLEAMGHLPMEEKPQQALPAVLQFLTKKTDA